MVLGIVMLVLTAIATDFSVFTLVSCSRRSGASTYEAVTDLAFGRRAKLMCMGLVICVTYLPLVAYTILLRDLLSPIAEVALERELSTMERNFIPLSLVVLVAPVCTIKSLNSLRMLSMCSIGAIFLLAVIIALRSTECVMGEGIPRGYINLWPEEGVIGALQAIPIFVCAFVCHFNVLPVHSELSRPTRRRLHKMVHWTVGMVASFYFWVGIMGYLYGACSGGVEDNILNNFGTDDTLMNIGRIGLSVTLLVSFPLLVVPLSGTLVRAHREITGPKGAMREQGEGGCLPCQQGESTANSSVKRCRSGHCQPSR
ncbi:unnamed protein product [Discosporangium mesarthrocarpum]